MDEFIAICKERGFHKETAGVLGIMAGSKEALTVFGDTIKAYAKLVEIAKNCSDEQDLLNKYTTLLNL